MTEPLVSLTLPARDAEPWLRQAAEDAAKLSAWCDHLTRKTLHAPSWGGVSLEDAKKDWRARFVRAKRIVESFGVEYQQTSEAETLTVDYPHVGGKTRIMRVPGIGPVGWRSGAEPDYKHPQPCYRGGVHAEACRQAADRVVRAWRATLERG